MKFILLILLLLGFLFQSNAQNHAIIKGLVLDSLDKKPLDFCTVAIVNNNDTTLIAYTLTNKVGSFELNNLPADKKVKLVITYASFKPYIKLFTLKKGDIINLGNIELGKSMLAEVLIRATRSPITINKDTVEFNALAFKTRPNAVVEELLKKIPGMQINGDGSITVNGKSVSKVLIDGKQYFGNNMVVATKNLDADIVSSVQVYDDRENDPDHLISDSKTQKIINLKLKRAVKKSTFGKVFAGGGTRGRYESGGLINTFHDTLQVSLIGLSNNLNSTAFSNNDLYSQGGFNRAGADNLYNGAVSTGGQTGGGIEKITSGGFNINTDYGRKLKINLLYFYSKKYDIAQTKGLGKQFLNDTTLSNSLLNQNEFSACSHSVAGLVDWKPDTLTTFHYVPRVIYSNNNSINNGTGASYNNFGEHINDTKNSSTNNNSSVQIHQDFYYNKHFKSKNEESFTIGHNLDVNPSHSDGYSTNDIHSYVANLQSDTSNRFSHGNNSSFSTNIYGNFRYPVTKKLVVDIHSSGTYNKYIQQNLVYDKNIATDNYDLYLTDLSTNFRRNQWIEDIQPGLTYNFKKDVKLVASVDFSWQQINNKLASINMFHNYLFKVPNIRLDAGPLSFGFTQNVDLPGLAELNPVTMVYNTLSTQTGNPFLKPSNANNVYINYNKYFNDAQLYISVYGNYSDKDNGVIRVLTIADNGAQTTRFVNRNGAQAYYLSVNAGKQFKKQGNWQLSTSTSVTDNTDRILNILNGAEGWQNRKSYQVSQSESVNWNDKVEVNVACAYNFSHTYYEYGDFKKVNTSTFNSNNNIIIRWPAKLIWETKDNFIYNSQVGQGIQKNINVVSSSLALQMLKKNRGEIKFTAYDVFDQNINVFRYTGENNVYDIQNNTLKRYFLLTLTYRFDHISAIKIQNN